MRRVVVTGLGCISPLGLGTKTTWTRLLAGQSGIVSTINHLNQNDINNDNETRLLQEQYTSIPSKVAAMVPKGDGDGEWNPKKYLSGNDIRLMARFSQYAVVAAAEAMRDAGFDDGGVQSEEEAERAGVCIGSGMATAEDWYNAAVKLFQSGYKGVSPLMVPRLLLNMAAGHVSMKFNLKGPNHSVSTACTTGLHSIGDAARFIKYGDADLMLAGGSESSVHPIAMAGFARARALSTSFNHDPEKACRPFDTARDGFVMGEGAGILVLESLEHALDRFEKEGVEGKIYAEIKGYGTSSDAYHITAPQRDGDGAYRAMRNCLRDASLKPSTVGYVNAHATGTMLGDAAENTAIKKLLLGEDGWRLAEEVCISSVKGALGHLLGAAGAVEAIVTVLAVKENILPPTLNLDNPGDPPEDFNCNYIPHKAQETPVDAALCNSFGFGGTNASICFTKFKL